MFINGVAFAFHQAAIRCLAIVYALIPMDQMKPNSSRATAVVIFLLSLPAAASLHDDYSHQRTKPLANDKP
jgi:hypothetical protein